MAFTANMNLDLPVVSTTLGPEWANLLNAALQVVDEHDHSSGKGVKVKTAGIEINADLDFASFRAFGLQSVRLVTQLNTLTGPTNAQSVYSVNGDLYYTSGSGTAIQLTAGGSIVPTPSAVETIPYTNIASNTTILPASTDVLLAVNTVAPRNITLPSAGAVAAGRLFVIKDAAGLSETNAITLLPDGTDAIDGQASFVFGSAYGSFMVASNGVDGWVVI